MNKSLSMYADMIFKHGVVVTVDKENSICEAVAVKGNKIVYVGDDAGVEMWKGENTKVIDLDGRALLPGFIDSHMHLGMTGQNAAVIIDCNSNDVTKRSARPLQRRQKAHGSKPLAMSRASSPREDIRPATNSMRQLPTIRYS